MKNQILKKTTKALLFIMIIIISACGEKDFLNKGPKGNLVVNLSMSKFNGSRTTIPDLDTTPASFIITGQGPNGSTFTRNVSAGTSSVQVNRLTIGEWVVSVEAVNSEGVSVGQGQESVSIGSGRTTTCNIVVSVFDGYGFLQLDIDWDVDLMANPSVEATLSRKGWPIINLDFTVTIHDATLDIAVPSGYYVLNVRVYDEVGYMHEYFGGMAEVVRVLQDQSTYRHITINNGSDPNDPDDNDPDNPEMPSPGAPSGTDAISSSTNHSDKKGETSPKLSPYAGAAFVQPPQVNNYGTVNLGYQVAVPPGRAGLQPGVGLSYSSSGGDGLVGIGWSMGTGLGVISRTTRHGQLYYDYRDTFTYNGKRLIKVEGPDESENGIYRLEIESGFSKLELTDAETGGVWFVHDKAGSVTIFGEDRSSRIYRPDNENLTYIWNFTRTYDLNGNYMTAEYDTSEYDEKHILYLKEIRYTGNYNEDTDANQYVRFEYTDRDDAYVSKAPGFPMVMDRLLDVIEVGWDNPSGWDNTELWHYQMVYETSEDSNRPLLQTVNSTRNSTQPEFIYQEAVHNFVWRLVYNPDYNDPQNNPDATKYFEGDFNGDGISDMVFFNPDTGEWKAAQGSRTGGYTYPIYANRYRGYDTDDEIQFFKGNVTGDYNGDGRSDIAFYLPATREFWVAEHTGTVFQFRRYGRLAIADLDIFKCEWFTGDYDGNGLSDAVLFDEPTGEWTLMRNVGRQFEFIKFSHHFQNLYKDDYNPDSNLDSVSTFDDSEFGKDRDKVHFLSGDYNGDGRTDISIYDSRSGRWYVAENYRDDTIGFKLEWKLYREFSAPEQALFGNDRFSGDFNGDGYSDFLIFDRATGEWTIGETGNGTINFRIFSRVPQFKDITRWLQGDFNGDGRTDIGFYSSTDNNFYIGEASPNGFRYRVYSNLSYGPDPEEVLEKAPLPGDEVVIKTGSGVVSNSNGTRAVSYKYDGNHRTGKGEDAFSGSFTGSGSAGDGPVTELLIYKRNNSVDDNSGTTGFHIKQGNAEPEALSNTIKDVFDPRDDDIKVLNNGKAFRYTSEREGILYFDIRTGEFKLFRNLSGDGAEGWGVLEIGEVTDEDFDITQDTHLTFEESVIILAQDDQNVPIFEYLNAGTETKFLITVEDEYNNDITSTYTNIFSNYRDYKDRVKLFAGDFGDVDRIGDTFAQILMVDTRPQEHRWFVGTANGADDEYEFVEIASPVQFVYNGLVDSYRVINEDSNYYLYYATNAGSLAFHRAEIDTDAVTQQDYSIGSNYTFNGDFDSEGNPIVHTTQGAKKVLLTDSGHTFADLETVNIDRPDLMQKHYPFRWIQGDYNGDGKTDIGFFHLNERDWYFALTQGTVPDMIHKVKNGIGGTYSFEYANSTSFDNTGVNSVPDLPMNYKVCTRLTVSDGRSMSDGTWSNVVTRYEYKNGYAFSEFINGYKETDYFGFGEFTVIDALGSRTISKYNNVPYDDFRMNRALAGAVYENRFIGSDHREYSRTETEYKLHEISTGPVPISQGGEGSFLIEPVEVRKYMHDELIQTVRSNIVLTPDEYEMVSKAESVTDHYTDEVHAPTSVLSYSEFDNVEATNEMRLGRKVSGIGNVNVEVDFRDGMPENTPNETTSTYEYDDRGNVVSEVTSYTGSGLLSPEDRVMEYVYDGYGNRTRTIDSSGSPSRISEKSYDEELFQFPIEDRAIGDNIVLETSYKINYNEAFGGIDAKIDANGNGTFFNYDELGRLKTQSTDTDAGLKILNEYEYNTSFPLSAKLIQHTGDETESLIETKVFADGMGRNVHTVRSAPDGRYAKTGMLIYDIAGRLIRKSQTDWADASEINEYIPNRRERHPTITEYDASGRTEKVTLPKGFSSEAETSVSYTYNDPWEVVETHSVGRSKRTVKNGRGLVLYVDDSGTGDDGTDVSAMIGFAYDLGGKRVKKMDLNSASMDLSVPGPPNPPGGGLVIPEKDDSGNNIAYWWYDGFGQLAAVNDPDLGYSGFNYDEFGSAIASVDGMNRRTDMEYDRLGRLVLKELPGDEGVVEYIYDTLHGAENGLGRVVAIDDSVQRKEFTYDKKGRIKREARIIKTETFQLQGLKYVSRYEFDLLDRKTLIRYPRDPNSNRSITARYSYNSMGVSSVNVDNGTVSKDIISNIDYNEFGQMTLVQRGNGTETEYTYDIKGRLSNLTTATNVNGANNFLQDVEYSFKVDNSISSVVNNATIDTSNAVTSNIVYNYQYDGLNRLVHASGSYEKNDYDNSVFVNRAYERGFSYAQNGNLTSKTIFDPDSHSIDDAWTYSYSNHAVTGIDTTAHGSDRFQMQYDAVGNMIYQADNDKAITKSMDYDSFNRIKQVTDHNSKVVGEYAYDDQGFRVRKLSRREVNGENRQIEVLYPSMYFGLEMHRTESGVDIEDSHSAVNNIYLNGVRVAAVLPSGTALYYLTDQVDSVKVVVDDTGNAVSRMEYLPYGETWFQEGDESHSPKYNSQELDKESGYYFYNARHYDPAIGRFVTADTVVDGELDTQGWNRFSYVKGNPIVYKDPTGHITVGEVWNKTKESVSNAVDTVKEKYNKGKEAVNKVLKQANEALDGKSKEYLSKAKSSLKSNSLSSSYESASNMAGALAMKMAEIMIPDSVDEFIDKITDFRQAAIPAVGKIKGYKPKPGERTLKGFVENNVPKSKEIGLNTKSPGFNNVKGTGGQFKRFGLKEHGGKKPHVHQPKRNSIPGTKKVRGTAQSKTKDDGVTDPNKKDVKQLYQYLFNNKYK